MADRRRHKLSPGAGTGVATALKVPPRRRPSVKAVAEVVADSGQGPKVQLLHGRRRVDLPTELVSLLLVVAEAAGSGEAVSVVVGNPPPAIEPAAEELSSQQAADLLNVSRPYVVKLARAGALPHRKVGNRHRFAADDVLAYRDQERRRREAVLAAMAPSDGYRAEDF